MGIASFQRYPFNMRMCVREVLLSAFKASGLSGYLSQSVDSNRTKYLLRPHRIEEQQDKLSCLI
jgi:hypothetical protein